MGKDNKLHVILLGRRNSGKSSLVNRLTGQQVAIVSDVAGTTTDPVKKSYEIPDFASVIFIDTAGIDDEGTLGEARVEKTRNALAAADMALLVIGDDRLDEREAELAADLKRWEMPFVIVHNKRDILPLSPRLRERMAREYNCPVVDFSALEADTSPVLDAMKSAWRGQVYTPQSLVGDLISPGDVVLLVTPIDSEAPAGRMILPQVQTLRDVLDNHAAAIVVQPDELTPFLERTGIRPRMVITDSQVFGKVAAMIPEEIALTSFSILLARQKGNFEVYLRGTPRIDDLRDGDRVLMLESCSHHVSCDDIGRHKIPRWIQQRTGKQLHFDFIAGLDAITRPVTDYALVIQCGGCMITPRQLRNRLQPAIDAHVPVSNYGMTIAYLHGIFERATKEFTAGLQAGL